MAWSNVKIPDITLHFEKDNRDVAVTLTNATSFNLSSINRLMNGQYGHNRQTLEGLNFLNHLLAHCPSKSLIPVGRKFFTANHFKLLGPVEFRRGVFQAVHFGGTESLTINVDVTTGIFWRSDNVSLADLVMQILRLKETDFARGVFTDTQYYLVARHLRGMKFTVRHLTHLGAAMARRQHTVTKLLRNSASDKTFEGNDGKTISIAEYMKKTYNLTLKYPRVFLVQKGPNTYLPLELCFVSQVSTSLSHSYHSSLLMFSANGIHLIWMRSKRLQ